MGCLLILIFSGEKPPDPAGRAVGITAQAAFAGNGVRSGPVRPEQIYLLLPAPCTIFAKKDSIMMKKDLPDPPGPRAAAGRACSKKFGRRRRETPNDTDSVAYVIGMNVGANLLKMDSTINVNAVCEGIRDMFRGNPRLSAADAETFYLSYVNYALPEKARAYEGSSSSTSPSRTALCPHVVGRDLPLRTSGIRIRFPLPSATAWPCGG